MNRLVTFMARRPLLWRLWMTLGAPLFFAGLLLDALVTLGKELYASWLWEWKAEVLDWFARFGETFRKSLL